jgi:hypothetical protein
MKSKGHSFPKACGFTGSAGKEVVGGYARGGRVVASYDRSVPQPKQAASAKPVAGKKGR